MKLFILFLSALVSLNTVVSAQGENCPSDGAYILDGASQYLSFAPYNPGTSDFTIEGWIKLDSYLASGRANTVFHQEQNGPTGRPRLAVTVETTGKVNFNAGHPGGGSSNQEVLSNAAIPLETWTYFACTRENGVYRIYIDGQLDATAAYGGNVDMIGISSPAYIGHRYNTTYPGTQYYVDGAVDEIRVSNVARAAEEIAAYYSSGSEMAVDADTEILWHMNGDAATPGKVSNAQGNDYFDLTENNSPAAGIGFPTGQTAESGTLLFAERYSTDAEFVRDALGYTDGQRYAYATRYFEVVRSPGEWLYLSGAPDTLAPLVCDDDILIDGQHAGPGLYTILDDTFPRGVPIESILDPKPASEIPLSLIGLGNNCVRIDLVDTHREVLGNTNIYLVRVNEPVAVQISSFTATTTSYGVIVEWRIFYDEPVEGIRLYRRQTGYSFDQIGPDLLDPVEVGSYHDEDVSSGRDYQYVMVVARADGSELRSHAASVATGALTLLLDQNHPNPFNPTTRISFTLPDDAHTDLSVFDVEGRLVRTLVNAVMPEGFSEVSWDGSDARGHLVGSGVYFYRLKAGKELLTKKMVLLK